MSWQLAQWLSTSGGCGPEPWLSDKPGTQLCKAPAWWAPHPPHWAHGSHWAGSWGVVHVKPPLPSCFWGHCEWGQETDFWCSCISL